MNEEANLKVDFVECGSCEQLAEKVVGCGVDYEFPEKLTLMNGEANLKVDFVECCICGQSSAKVVGCGEDYEYHTSNDKFYALQCDTCSLVYLNPRPSVSEFQTIYPPNYHAFDFSAKKFGFVYTVRARLEANRALKRCGSLGDGARILDVGCGDGFHLKLLQEYGNKTWILEGVDLDERAAKKASKAGIKVHLGTVEEIALPKESYDMVFLIQTIEHVENPVKVLSAIYDLLKPGGKLAVVTDNTGSCDFRFYKKRYWGGYHFPRHWNLFNKKSFRLLIQKTKFEIEDLSTIVSPVNWVYSIHNSLVGKKKSAWLIKQFTLQSVFPLFVFTVVDFVLQKFGKGALLQATLKKPL
jgi:2-polyprenyl-3-methyl-5-hydroxy-6-metoxy-1,4-benzoquinol methylase